MPWHRPHLRRRSSLAAKDGPIVYGHHHINVTSADEHKKFWVDTLGGTAIKIGTNNQEIIRFPNALMFMRAQKPSAGTKGSTVDHIGFSVPNLRPRWTGSRPEAIGWSPPRRRRPTSR